MFLEVRTNNFICYDCGVLSQNNIEQVNDDFLMNLSSLCQITIKKCSINMNYNSTVRELKYKIEFDRFVDEGVLNYFSIFFTSKKDKEFRRIKRAIKALINKENKMSKSSGCTPLNGPSTTGNPSGGGRGNCPSK